MLSPLQVQLVPRTLAAREDPHNQQDVVLTPRPGILKKVGNVKPRILESIAEGPLNDQTGVNQYYYSTDRAGSPSGESNGNFTTDEQSQEFHSRDVASRKENIAIVSLGGDSPASAMNSLKPFEYTNKRTSPTGRVYPMPQLSPSPSLPPDEDIRRTDVRPGGTLQVQIVRSSDEQDFSDAMSDDPTGSVRRRTYNAHTTGQKQPPPRHMKKSSLAKNSKQKKVRHVSYSDTDTVYPYDTDESGMDPDKSDSGSWFLTLPRNKRQLEYPEMFRIKNPPQSKYLFPAKNRNVRVLSSKSDSYGRSDRGLEMVDMTPPQHRTYFKGSISTDDLLAYSSLEKKTKMEQRRRQMPPKPKFESERSQSSSMVRSTEYLDTIDRPTFGSALQLGEYKVKVMSGWLPYIHI